MWKGGMTDERRPTRGVAARPGSRAKKVPTPRGLAHSTAGGAPSWVRKLWSNVRKV